MITYEKILGGVLTAALLATSAGCDSFLEVTNPNSVEATSVDPVKDAESFARSAFQNLAVAYGGVIVYSAWFTNEARVGDTFPTRNEFGRRLVDNRNGTHNAEVWTPLVRAATTGEDVIELLEALPDKDSSIHRARAALAAGYAMLLMGETFCTGTVRTGPPMNTTEMLDHAISRLQTARDIGVANGTDAGTDLANAARVGIARAQLQKGDLPGAAATAAQVPDDFVYNVSYVDDPSFRNRLGNNVYAFSSNRESLVVGPEWRAIADAGDERISYVDGERNAQDGVQNFFIQQKFDNWAAPIRLASKLEARYIEAEAGTIDDQLDLINERRAANGQTAFNSTVPAEVLAELMDQKGRDFWLEGKRMGDWRRNPDAVQHILDPGDNYYKPEVGQVSNQTCWPLPLAETDNNPNFN